MAKVLVVAVHPDDETLGAGGTLLKHKSSGDSISWIICTDIKESDGFKKNDIDNREKEIQQVSALYDFNQVYRLGLSTTKVDQYFMDELVEKFSKIFNEFKPEIVYLPFKGDVHSDHRKIFDAAYSCTKSFRYPFIKQILMIETLSETEFAPGLKEDSFTPNIFVDISMFFQRKIEIMKIFKSEMKEHPFPRSERNITALATFRGATAGCEYAESFMLLKEIK